jgi:hypothetical protein
MSCCGVTMPDCGNPACELCGRIVPWIRQQVADEEAAREQRLVEQAAKQAAKRAARKGTR